MSGIASAPATTPASRDDREWIECVARWVGEQLRVRCRPFRFQIVEGQRGLSFARLPRDGAAPTVVVSRDRLRFDCVAHEICHCFVPSRHPVIGEGLAHLVGCRAAGDCSHLALPGRDLRRLLLSHRTTAPRIEDLLELPSIPEAAHRFTLKGQLGLAVAACFVGFCLASYPGFAARAARPIVSEGVRAVEEAAEAEFSVVRAGWNAWLA